MTFDWHMLYPLHTVILDNSHVFGGVPCRAQLCNFSKWFFSPLFRVVPIRELWQFCYVRIGPPKMLAVGLEFGVHPGTCRSLRAIYKQLHRAFKVAEALGRWCPRDLC